MLQRINADQKIERSRRPAPILDGAADRGKPRPQRLEARAEEVDDIRAAIQCGDVRDAPVEQELTEVACPAADIERMAEIAERASRPVQGGIDRRDPMLLIVLVDDCVGVAGVAMASKALRPVVAGRAAAERLRGHWTVTGRTAIVPSSSVSSSSSAIR